MKVILLKDIKNLGQKDTIISVSDGYAINALFPQGLAKEYSKSAEKSIENNKKLKESEVMEESKGIADKINSIDKNFVIEVSANETGRLFEKINAKKLANTFGIDEKYILTEDIKEIGVYDVEIKFNDKIKKIKVEVKNESSK